MKAGLWAPKPDPSPLSAFPSTDTSFQLKPKLWIYGDEAHSITRREAYWAGEIDVIERGEPSMIPINSVNDVQTAIIKAA